MAYQIEYFSIDGKHIKLNFDGTPFEAKKALLDRTVPIVIQDLQKLITEDPNLAPQIKALLAAGAIGGAGVQTYGR